MFAKCHPFCVGLVQIIFHSQFEYLWKKSNSLSLAIISLQMFTYAVTTLLLSHIQNVVMIARCNPDLSTMILYKIVVIEKIWSELNHKMQTHWCLNKMANISQMTFSKTFCWMQSLFQISLKFVPQYWFRYLLGAKLVTGQWWFLQCHIAGLGYNETKSPGINSMS